MAWGVRMKPDFHTHARQVERHVEAHGHEEAVHDDKREKAKAQILPISRLEVGPLAVDA